MLASLLAWSLVAGVGALMVRVLLSRWEVIGPDGSREIEETTGHEVVKWGGRLALTSIALGSASFLGLGLAGGGAVKSSGTTSAFNYSAPNAPNASVSVTDTSTWIVSGGAFVGSGDATHDSTNIQVDRSGGNFSSPLTEVTIGAQTTDTLSDNTDWKADSTYIVRMRYKANPNKGGWSAYDSVTVINSNAWPIHTNEPAGMEELWDWDGTFKAPLSGWTAWVFDSITIVSSASHPSGATRDVMRFHWLPGQEGAGITEIEPFTPTVDTIYLSYWIRWPTDYPDSTTNSGQKVPGYLGTTANYNAAYSTRESDGTLLYTVQVTSTQPCSVAGAWPSDAEIDGSWIHYEELSIAETPDASSNNGKVTVWIDGVQVCNNTSVNWQASGTPGFRGYEWYNYHSVTQAGYNFYEVAEFYASGS